MASRRQRLPGTVRRAQIADAALDIIGRRGLTALTTTSLASSVGLTSGALFRHFATREAILDEAVQRAVALLAETLPPGDDAPLARLRQLALARVQLLRAQPGIAWLLRSEEAALSLPPQGVEQLEGMIRRTQEAIRGAIAEGVRGGEIRTDIAPSTLQVVFTSTVHALVTPAPGPARPRRPSPNRVVDELFRMFAPLVTSPSPRS
ncbi:MAG: TetR/AcrR family transcriptional regulator [Planctomycetota bacterium]